MNQATHAWTAFQNMLRAAAHDPIWALTTLVFAPFRAIKSIVQAVVLLGIVALVVGLGGALALDAIGFGEGTIPMMALDIILPVLLIIVLFRLITNPLIIHFGERTAKPTARLVLLSTRKWLPSPAPPPAFSSGAMEERESCCAMKGQPIC